MVVSHRQKVSSGIRAGDNDDIVAAFLVLVRVAVDLVERRSGLDLGVVCRFLGFWKISLLLVGRDGQDLFLVNSPMARHFDDLALDCVDGARDDGVIGAVRHLRSLSVPFRGTETLHTREGTVFVTRLA
jgi:hypothetical protein